MRYVSVVALVSLAMLSLGSASAGDAGEVAKQAYQLLKTTCYECHNSNPDAKGGYFDVLNLKSMLVKGSGNEIPYVTPGKPDKSLIYQRACVDRDMPPKKKEAQYNPEQIKLLGDWIVQNCPEVPKETEPARPILTDFAVLKAVDGYLQGLDADIRHYQRFFSLVNLHNCPPDRVTARDLRITRAALSKAINSMSWMPDIVLPKPVDGTYETVYAVDLRDLDWDDKGNGHYKWSAVASIYPYGLSYTDSNDANMRNLAIRVKGDMGTELFWIRADWFCTVATNGEPVKSPTDPQGKYDGPYHQLLAIPENIHSLEHKLGVDRQANFDRDRLARAGFNATKVGFHNRLVERHTSLYGAYWISYDFKNVSGREHSLAQSPLGPQGITHGKYAQMEFQHDGGEIVFNLPNGLQGYMLANGKGDRIDAGPADVVSDSQRTLGYTTIFNGISCMACHNLGMKPVVDEIRASSALQGAPLTKAQPLYPPVSTMDKYLEKDRKRFLTAVEEATLQFLSAGSDAGKKLSEFPEPILIVAQRYSAVMTFADICNELQCKPEKLEALIQVETRLSALSGMTEKAGSINRELWQDRSSSTRSLYQKAAYSLGEGTPLDSNN